MFKRNEPKPESSRRRDRSDRAKKKRRLLMEDLEARRLLATLDLPVYDGPRNIGTVQAVQFLESETNIQNGLNDAFGTADVVPLGTGPGQDDTIDVIGNLSFTASNTFPPRFTADLDTFAVDLKAGTVLDIATQGAAGQFSVFFEDGTLWYGVDFNNAIALPPDSPLQTDGNAAFAQVIPRDGRYFITVSPITTASSYTMGLRAYRPSIESAPIGTRQILFVDFDGATYPRAVFDDGTGIPQPGVIRLPSLRESLPLLGIQAIDDASFNRLIDLTMAETIRMFEALGTLGTNGHFDTTGNPGDFGITVLNSRDHPDPGLTNPLVTRVILGGTVNDSEIQTIGISSTLDIGNFSMDDIVIGLLDGVLGVVGGVPIAPTSSIIDQMGDFLAFLVAHEAGHSFGMRHTASAMSPNPFPDNEITNIMDEGPGSDFGQVIGAGPDGIYGTVDDVDVNFVEDRFSYREGLDGQNHTDDSLSQTLATGTRGGGINGVVFNDLNADGNRTGDPGIANVSVFADINGNGVRDATEPFAVSTTGGNYVLTATPGDYNLIVSTPPNVTPTTPTIVPVSVSTTGTGVTVDFGFTPVLGAITGFAFSDDNGNGTREAGEGGVGGIFHYLDLDRDDRPDLGEPNAISNPDGTYNINFPGPGNYTIRQVVPPGFTQTSPASGEHTFVFDGVSLATNYNFGLLPSRDFGDAPDTAGTTLAAGGASHGITDGLMIGAAIDRELDGSPSVNADGDDSVGRVLQSGAIEDDEDGVVLLDPLGPGSRSEFQVTVTNTSGSPAFLQGFMDFNGDGDFDDAGEQFLSNIPVPVGTNGLVLDASDGVFVDVPATANVGTTYARFRLSQEAGIGPRGNVDTGEVEDHRFTILGSADVVIDDEFSVSRNTLANELDVLRNDFQTAETQLTIRSVNTTGTNGVVVPAGDGKSLFYTPPNGFIGRDAFTYTVNDQTGNAVVDDQGNPVFATVVVNVTFQSAVPIALDDSFEVPEGSVNRALNVLDNDVPSTSGGLSIISVTPGSAGGTISIIGGGQSLRYTPLPGFNGTEQFSYSVQDSVGLTSSAEVTINLLPGARTDDVVEFSIGIFDALNQQQEISNVQVGDEFIVRVMVDHVELFANPEGVASAFMDLLYTDELVATLSRGINPNFPFDIQFGDKFSGSGVLQRGNADIPGLIDEVGAIQSINADLGDKTHADAIVLFDLSMQAVSPGVAVFTADPADSNVNETTTLGSDVALEVNQLRFGSAELVILPRTDNFASAIDDSFPEGRDSDGFLISSASAGRNRLDVLANDNLGPTGIIREFGLVTAPSLGNVLVEDNGTPTNLNDDFLSYRPNIDATGLDSFTYVIVTDDGVRSTAEVTIPLGNTNANADVSISYRLVNENGVPITNSQIAVGDRVGIEVVLEDLRNNPTFVFAAYHDLLYDNDFLRPTDTVAGGLDFDVTFENGYLAAAAVGTNARPGLLDEFGTLFERTTFPEGDFSALNPITMATVFFEAVAPGTTKIVGGPADTFPAQETLLLREDDPVTVDRIRYSELVITVNSVAVGPTQNTALPQDVNADGFVSPRDALLVINAMEREEARFEGETGSNVASQYYTDVNGDTRLSAIDALQVINYLAIQANQAALQAESVETGTDLASSAGSDAVFADLSGSDLVVDTSSAGDASSAAVGIATDDSTEEDDDENDVLNLLADDVSSRWN